MCDFSALRIGSNEELALRKAIAHRFVAACSLYLLSEAQHVLHCSEGMRL